MSTNDSSNSPILSKNSNNNSNSNSNNKKKSNKSGKSSGSSKTNKRNRSSGSSNKRSSQHSRSSNNNSNSSKSGRSGNSSRGGSGSNSPRRGGASSSGRSSVSQTVFATKDVNSPDQYKKKTKIVPLETDKNAIKWWDRDIEELLADTKKWHTLDHNGVVFAPPYEPHGVKMKYNGKAVDLTPKQEEIATMYAVMLETDWITKPAFQKNFMCEFRKILNDGQEKRRFPFISDLSKCDFRDIYDWYQKKKEAEKELKKR